MDREQQAEAIALAETARALVVAEPRGLSLMLTRLPSFADSESISITRDSRKDALRVCHVRWDKTVDLAKLDSPVERLRWPRQLEPTIIISEQGVDAELAASILQELNAIPVSARIEANSIGLDGTSYEVSWMNGNSQACFRWWESGPSEWRDLVDWFDRTWEHLKSAISAR